MTSSIGRTLSGVLLVAGAAIVACSSSSSGSTGTNSTDTNHESSSGSESSGGNKSSSKSSSNGSGGSHSSSGSAGSGGGQVNLTVASQFALVSSDESSVSCDAGADGGEDDCTTTSSGKTLIVALTNRSGIDCSAIDTLTGTQASFANFQALALEVATTSNTLQPGTYNVATQGTTSGAGGSYTATDGTCANVAQYEASAGTVTITTITDTMATGTYDLTFGTNGKLSGSFSTSICAIPDGGLQSSGDAGTECIQ